MSRECHWLLTWQGWKEASITTNEFSANLNNIEVEDPWPGVPQLWNSVRVQTWVLAFKALGS
jgi:hypothetical protein